MHLQMILTSGVTGQSSIRYEARPVSDLTSNPLFADRTGDATFRTRTPSFM